MTATIADVLDEAARIIRRNGWANSGDFYDPDWERDASECRVCTLGAIAVALGGDPDDWGRTPMTVEAAEAVRRFLKLELIEKDYDDQTDKDRLLRTIGRWNDGVAENMPAVIAALEGAAAAERAKVGAA